MATMSDEDGIRGTRWLLPVAGAVAIAALLGALSSPDIAAGFRQAQTGISSYWMLHGGPWLDYWTPVLGYPWAVPFEFPLYQWIVAAIAGAGIGLDVSRAGVLVSFAWLAFSLWPIYYLARSYGLSALSRRIVLFLFVLAPVYLDMGTSLMIETQATALSLGWLALLRVFVVSRSPMAVVAGAGVGTLAALTKVTTIPPYLALGAAMALTDAWRRRHRPGTAAATLLGALALVVPLVVATVAWNHHIDALKSLNSNAAMLRSDTPFMVHWTFGTLDQRVSPRLAKALARILIDTLGPLVPVLLVILAVLARRAGVTRDSAVLAAMLMAAFLLPIALLTNLYIHHGYYQAANTVFAVAAFGILLGDVILRERRFGIALLGMTAVSQVGWFVAYHRLPLFHPSAEDRAAAVGRALHALIPKDAVVAIYGLDWSSTAPFYAERKAVMETEWASTSQRHRRLARLFEPVGGQPMGAVVHCPSTLDADPFLRRRFAQIAATHRRREVSGCAIYVA